MFLLHERTRKSLCRIGFIALCVLPTCAVALWAAGRTGDGHRGRCEAELSRLLRLRVTLGSVEYPEPGVVRYTDFQLADPDTEALIASARQLEVRTINVAKVIAVAEVKIEVSTARALAELLHDRLRERTGMGRSALRLTIGELKVAARSGETALLDVSVRVEPTRAGSGAEFKFRTAEMATDSSPAVLTIVRSRDARIGFELHSHGSVELQTALAEPVAHPDSFHPVVRLLRALVGDNQVLVPARGEAEQLMNVSL